MLRWIKRMAAALNLKGRIFKGGNTSLPKGAPSQQQHTSLHTKPPTKGVIGASQSATSLLGALQSPSLTDSRSNGSCRPYSAGQHPVNFKNLEDVATCLHAKQARRVVIVAGAGISTPSGIPDFRSPGTGLYDNLQQYNIPYPEAIFDIDYFHYNPWPFFMLARELYPSGRYRPNYIHYFARLLHDQGILLRMYTQNIDGLERIAGLPAEKLVEAHGTFSTATCVSCQRKYEGEEIKDRIFADKLPICKHKSCGGIVKPDIVFFGEELPKRFYFYLKDMLQTDLVLIMGTSLEVQPFAGIIETVRFNVPRVLFNRDAVGPFRKLRRPKDFVSEGDLIEKVREFVNMAGWEEDMIDLITRMEGTFKTAFPPPPPSQKKDGKKTVARGRPNYLAAMWRRHGNEPSESDDSTDTDSGTVPSEDSDTSTSEEDPRMRRNKPTVTRSTNNSVGKNAGKPASSLRNREAVNDSKLGRKDDAHCATETKLSSRNIVEGGSAGCGDGAGGKVLNSKTFHASAISSGIAGGVSGNSGSQRHYSQQAAPSVRVDLSRKLRLLALRDNSDGKATRTGDGTGGVPSKSESSHRKPPVAPRKFLPQKSQPSPGMHPIKPRSNSVNRANAAKASYISRPDFKALQPRVTSANPEPSRLVYRHRGLLPAVYNPQKSTLTDSSSSDDEFDDVMSDRDSDDSSDDSQ